MKSHRLRSRSPAALRLTLTSLAVLTLAGCALGPRHVAPTPAVLANAPQWYAKGETSTNAVPPSEFFKRWEDASLGALIEEAMKNAATLEQAQARIAQSRAGVTVARSALLPGANASTSANRGDQGQGQGVASVFAGAVQAAWELDLFGVNRRSVEAARARAEARERDLDDARVSLAADIATVYINLRVNEALLTGFERDAKSRDETDRLTQLKTDAGFEAPANAALAAAASQEAKARVASQRAEVDEGVKTLVSLTAIAEPRVRAMLQPRFAQIASPPSIMTPAIPANVLAKRADLASLERELAAAIADIGVAEADRYPRISLSGTIGYSATRAMGATLDGATWGFGPSISLPIFDAGRRAANVDIAKARHAELSATYRATALRAVREVEEALTRIQSAREREADQRAALSNYEAFERAARARLSAGVGSVLELEDARRAVLGAQVNVLSLEREKMTAWISLYRAVGGDWQPSQDSTTARAPR